MYKVLFLCVLFCIIQLLSANTLNITNIETDILLPSKALEISKTVGTMLLYRFTAEIKGKSYTYVATNQTENLFISPYSRYYTFGALSKSFYFGNLEFNDTELTRVFEELGLSKNKDAPRWFQNWEEAKDLNDKILTDILNSTGLAQYDFMVCDETFRNYFEISFASEEKQYLMAKSYYCCDKDNKCRWVRQTTIMAFVHFIFAVFKIGITMMIIQNIRNRASSLWIDAFEAQHVTCSYMTPPFWIFYILPSFLKKRAYDIRFWVRGIVVCTLIAIFFLNIVHSMAPLEWPYQLNLTEGWRNFVISQDNYFRNVEINGEIYPGMWLFIFIIFPVAVIISSITTFCYLSAPRGSYESYLLSKEVEEYPAKLYRKTRIIETIIRVIISLPLSAVSSFFIMFFLLKSHEVYEYNDVYMFSNGAVLSVLIMFYLMRSPIFISISSIAFKIKSEAEKTQEKVKHLNLRKPLTPTNSSNGKKKDVDLPPNTTYLLMIIPSIIFEAFWFNSIYLLTYIAASVFTRTLWSLMLMMILYPDTLQTIVFIATILGTMIQFVISLGEPHKRVKAMMLDELPLVPKGYVKDNNAWLLSMDTKEIQRRTLSLEKHSYFVLITWKQFHDWCAQMNVFYFVWLKVMQMVFTVFVLSLFFFGAIVFNFSATGSSDILKLGIITLMPLVPRAIELIDRNDVVMTAAFKKRFKGGAGSHANGNSPPEIQVPHKKQFGVHPTSAVLKPIPWVKRHVKFTDEEGNAILETFVIPDNDSDSDNEKNGKKPKQSDYDFFDNEFEPPPIGDFSANGQAYELGVVDDNTTHRYSGSHSLLGSDLDIDNSTQQYYQFNEDDDNKKRKSIKV